MTAAARRRQRSGAESLDVELADLPPAARWREWMLRVEAAIFASQKPVAREALVRLVGEACRFDDLIADLIHELRGRPYDLSLVAGGYALRTGLQRLFPRPETLASADLTTIGLTRARAATISALARAVAADRDLMRPFETLDATVERLVSLPGIGPWTAQYIAMRALRQPDAFPASDLGLLRAMATPEGRPSPAALTLMAEAWRPWRAYAAQHLWMSEAAARALVAINPAPSPRKAAPRNDKDRHPATPAELRVLQP